MDQFDESAASFAEALREHAAFYCLECRSVADACTCTENVQVRVERVIKTILAAALREAAREENEANAQIAASHVHRFNGLQIANAIRARIK